MNRTGWRFFVDRGGTFTDAIGVAPDGAVHVAKVLSSDDAPLIAIRALLGLGPSDPIAPCELRMGTTLATNALLTRSGVPVGLVVTHGFEDLLEIADQARPELFALNIKKEPPLALSTRGIESRADKDGEPLQRASDAALATVLDALRTDGAESIAVALLHGTRCPALETAVGVAANAAGFEHVTLSHRVDGAPGFLARAETSVLDAYLTPLLSAYLRRIETQLAGSRISVMQSSGALTSAATFSGRNAVLSGPAGGVVAVGEIARAAGLERAIGFDMGGTSTDVCRWEGEPEKQYETHIAGVRLRVPMLAIHTVAAGGGSILTHDGARMAVGPESAGAAPGPLAYGHRDANEPTLTDANLVLGRLAVTRFPFPLDEARALRAFEAMSEETGGRRNAIELAEGFVRIAIDNMAEAIRRVTIARGHDAREHGLVIFGGAGGQHACALARRLGIRRVIVHPLDGVLSALGIGVASIGWHGTLDVQGRALDDSLVSELPARFERLEAEGRAELATHVAQDADHVLVVRSLDLHYEGTQTVFVIDASSSASMRAAFEQRHERELGYVRPDASIVARVARVELRLEAAPLQIELPTDRSNDGESRALQRVRIDGAWHDDTPVLQRERLGSGASVDGPALIASATSVLLVEPGWTCVVLEDGLFELSDRATQPKPAVSLLCDPIELEIFANAFMSIAQQMGVVLQRTAQSTNIRERLDFSCAVFDGEGQLIANAPHIPVHLGAMGETVLAVLRAHPDPELGDVFASNHPAAGGSHLPDITVVSPVFVDGALRFFVANRGHHADVGGITPGSMPPFSTSLDEEGVVFDRQRIVSGGRLERAAILERLHAGPHPARLPLENLADLEAQIAANARGVALLIELCDRTSADVVAAYMGHVQDDAARRVSNAIERLADGEHTFSDQMDDGAVIAVRAVVRGGRMHVDFEGTSAELADSNLNAPRAVTVAALLYVLRCMVGENVPLNAGCLRPVTLSIPERSILDPGPTRAVAGGNVETSQRVVDVLLAALGLLSASQGTMNNVTFGDSTFGYYETVAGGAGAGPGFDGASCVHTHMTNSRITDVEVLEQRFPVRVRRFLRRRGSGGDGAFVGGDGVIREIEALRPLEVSILSERRTRAPFGLNGGQPGERGRNRVWRADDASEETLEGRSSLQLAAGDRISIETPGGGGWGEPA